jgi:hypothetical protein
MATSGRNPRAHRVQQRHGEGGLAGLGRLHPPRQRQAGDRADNLVELVAVERSGRPGADRRAVAPSGVRVAVGLALRPALVQVPLAVGVSGQVAGVNGDGLAQLGKLLVQGGGHAVNAGVQQRLEPAQLGREAVAGMHTRHACRVGAAEGGTEGVMLADQCNGARLGRRGVERLRQRHADHRADRVAGPARPAGGRKLSHEGVDLRAVEQHRKLHSIGTPWYGQSGHGGYVSLVLTPGGYRLAGVALGISCKEILDQGCDKAGRNSVLPKRSFSELELVPTSSEHGRPHASEFA